MVTLAQIIQYMYPAAEPLRDFTIEQKGSTETITAWNATSLGAQPSVSTIASNQSAAQTYWNNKEAASNSAKQDLQNLVATAQSAITTNNGHSNNSSPNNGQLIQQVKNLSDQNTAILKALLRLIDVNNS